MNNNDNMKFHNADNDRSQSESPAANDTQFISYGVSYSPSTDNNGYSVERYQVENDADGNRKVYPDSDAANRKPKEKKKARTSRNHTGLIVIALVLCIAISFSMGFGSALLQNMYSDNSAPVNTEYANKIDKHPNGDKSFVDKSAPVRTEVPVAPGSLMSMEDAIESVKDSVVEITTETVKSGFGGYSQYVVSGAGSGVIITTGGYIVTNNHVIEGASNILVRLTDGSEYEAELVGTDSKTDIAVISIVPEEGKELSSALIGSSASLRLGQTVIAIGNPLGELGGTVTDGIISSLAREVAMEGSGSMTLLQTNAAVSPGNSGGGLFDLYGRLIGVVNAKTSGQGVEGISFAIPIDTAWDIACQLMDKGYVSGRPTLGISLKEVQYSAGFFGDIYSQVVVAQDHEGYGLRTNDIIVSINGLEIIDLNDVSESIASNSVGDSIVVRILRDRKYYELKVTLVEYVPSDIQQEI